MSDQDERAAWDQDRQTEPERDMSPTEFARHVFGPKARALEAVHAIALAAHVAAGRGAAASGSIRGRSVVLIALDLGPARTWGPPDHPED